VTPLRTAATVGALVAVCAAAGWLFGGGFTGLTAGTVCGMATGLAVVRLRIRPVVAVTVVAGTAAGALVGQGVVRALCRPGSCRSVETVAAVLTGMGALIGVGLVVALVTRSFDEYRETTAANRPPPTPGREPGEGGR